MKGRVHSIETYGTVDGPGVRFVVFFQGCPLQCKYCHNRDTWDVFGGELVKSRDIINHFKKYLSFYLNSGGGLTASGGEPTLQPEFLRTLFAETKRLGANTALDTTGHVDIANAEIFLDVTDLVLLDIKIMDREKHKDLTGVSNERIINFSKYLEKIGKPIWIRHVVIPGITDSQDDIYGMANFIKEMDNVEKVELLPYNKFGVEKWKALGSEYPLEGIKPPSRELLKDIAGDYQSLGIEITIG
ncbi:MAG: pyruvate formate lyase-activating protein [Clostridia bacterium]|nr:pyruvate formate lyase-activating protein [Clostridia bacterium]